MKNFVRMTVLAAAAVALSACGGGAKLGGGKQGAAEALYQASDSTGKTGNQRVLAQLVNRAKALRAQAVASGATSVSASITSDCAHGGSATLTVDTDNTYAGDTNVSLVFDVSYDSCNEDGKNEIDGDMTMGIYLAADSSSFEAKVGMKGQIDISGEISDSLKADVTESIGVNGTSGQVSVKLNGTIETSTEKYAYANETFTFSADATLPAADDKA